MSGRLPSERSSKARPSAPSASSGRVSRRAFVQGSAAVAASGAGLLAGCSGGGDEAAGPGGEGAAAGRTQFSFLAILPPETLTFAPELFADAAGYFADEGLDVDFELTRGSPQAIQLVLAGWSPLTRISQIEGMRAAANRGAPVINVGMVMKDSTIRYVSHESSPLREPRDIPRNGESFADHYRIALSSARLEFDHEIYAEVAP